MKACKCSRKFSCIFVLTIIQPLPLAAQPGQQDEPAKAHVTEYAEAVREADANDYRFRTGLALAPNGRWLALATDTGVEITAVDDGGTQPAGTVPLPDGVNCYLPRWNQTSDALALGCGRSGAGPELYVWRRDQAKASRVADAVLLNDAFDEPAFFWLPGGRQLMYRTQAVQVDRADSSPEPSVQSARQPVRNPSETASCPAMGHSDVVPIMCSDSIEIFRSSGIRPRPGGRAPADDSNTPPAEPTYLEQDVMVVDVETREQSTVATLRLPSSRTVIVPVGTGEVLLVTVPRRTEQAQRADSYVVNLEALQDKRTPVTIDADLIDQAGGSAVRHIKADVMLVPELVFENQTSALAPNARVLAWIEPGTPPDLYARSLAIDTLYLTEIGRSGETHPVSLDGPRLTSDPMLRLIQPAGEAKTQVLWTPDERHALAVASQQIWVVYREDRRSRLLAAPAGRAVNRLLSHNGRHALVTTVEIPTGQYGIWQVVLSTGEWSRIVEDDIALSHAQAVEAADGSVSLAYVASTSSTPSNVYAGRWQPDQSSAAAMRQVTHNTITVPLPPVESRVLTYEIEPDRFATAVLVRPDGVSDPVPTILYAYPADASSNVSRHRNSPCLGGFKVDAAELVCGAIKRGYGMLMADVPLPPQGVYGPRGPVADMVSGVVAAIDAAAETGWVDTKRLGVIGASQGGYMVNSAVAHTNRFRAAVSIAGISNMTSRMAAGTGFGREWVYSGPGRMEIPISEDPIRYVINSPSAYVENVTTPLLLITGLKDLHVHYSQSEEMFRGLALLGKPAELVRYRDAAHDETWYRDAAYSRALDWFTRWFEEPSQ